jgi:signal transduction histidine kinase
MVERARLIGAELQIKAAPGQGTRIQIRWHPRRDTGD